MELWHLCFGEWSWAGSRSQSQGRRWWPPFLLAHVMGVLKAKSEMKLFSFLRGRSSQSNDNWSFRALWFQERRRPIFRSPSLRDSYHIIVGFLWGFSGVGKASPLDWQEQCISSLLLFKSHGSLKVWPGEWGLSVHYRLSSCSDSSKRHRLYSHMAWVPILSLSLVNCDLGHVTYPLSSSIDFLVK